MNHTRLESMFRKKHNPHVHVHPSRHIRAHHAHTHDTINANVYTCTHCNRKGHLAKFCYDKINDLNFTSKNVWVRKGANPRTQESVGTKIHSYCI